MAARKLSEAEALSFLRNFKSASGAPAAHYEHYAVELPSYVAGNHLQWQYAAMNGIRTRMRKPDPIPFYHHGDGYVGAGALLPYDPRGAAAAGIDRLRDSYAAEPQLSVQHTLPTNASAEEAHYKQAQRDSHISTGALHAYINSLRTRKRSS